jgi:hypothetical protein
MKYIQKISIFFLSTLISGIVFNSCTKDTQTIVTPKTVDQYVKEQLTFVNSELVFTRSILTVGYNLNEYSVSLNAVTATRFVTIKAAYLNALMADSAILVSPNVTIPQVVASNQTLGASGKTFRGAINLCDKRPLNDAIVAANALNASVLVGTAIGTVPQAAKTAFTAAITAASTTRDASTTVIDRQITDALAKLKAGTDAFNAAIIK